MVNPEEICAVILRAEMCLSNIVSEYCDKITYGYEDKDAQRSKSLLLRSYIRILKDYISCPKIDTKKVFVSNKGRFSLESNEKSLSLEGILTVNPDFVNCLTSDQICELIKKVTIICPNC